MAIKPTEQRVEALIDVQNLYHSAKNLYKSKVNFREILKTAIAGRKFIRAFAYVVKTKTGEEKPFFEALTKLGIEMRVKDLQEFYDGMKKADWDVGITVDAIRLSPNLDALILVSGDGDYVPLVEYLQNQGKQVEVIAFGETASSKLREVADDFTDLSAEKGKFLIQDRRYAKNIKP